MPFDDCPEVGAGAPVGKEGVVKAEVLVPADVPPPNVGAGVFLSLAPRPVEDAGVGAVGAVEAAVPLPPPNGKAVGAVAPKPKEKAVGGVES